MANSGLRGPFRLDVATVVQQVARVAPGAYALGKVENGTFYIRYVGRSDSDVAARLKQWIGHYTSFKFEYFPSPKAAFEKECHLWHDFGGPEGTLDNDVHPRRPNGANWQCPRCRTFEAIGARF